MAKAWLIRPNPHNIYRMREFSDGNLVAIGWPEIGSLLGKTKDEIKNQLKHHHLNYSPDQLGAATSTANKFVNEIRTNDIAVIPDDDNIYFYRITSDYYYNVTKSSQSEGYPHQRKAELIKGPVRRDDIPDALRQSLRAPRALADLSHHIDSINNFINNRNSSLKQPISEPNDDFAYFDYPIRLNKVATIKIPKNITLAEASRLGDFIKTLYFE